MNYEELRVVMMRKKITNREMAAKLSLSEQALYNKLNGVSEFKNSEIKKITTLLDLSMDDVNLIFFDGIVN